MHDMKGPYAQLMRHVIYCSHACSTAAMLVLPVSKELQLRQRNRIN